MALSKKLAWVGGIGSAVLAGLIVEWVKDFPVLRWLGGAAVTVWHWLWAPGSLPHVAILLLSAAAIAVALRLAWLMAKSRKISAFDYTSDSFFDINWQWYYTHGRIADYSVVPICPQCQMQMVFRLVGSYRAIPRTQALCENCSFAQDFEFNEMELRERVVRLIQRNIRTGDHLPKVLAARSEKRKSK